MTKRLFTFLAALLLVAAAVPTAWATLADLGIPIDPHGYPAFYEDAGGLQLELCLPPPAGNATRAEELCFFDPLDLTEDELGNPTHPIYVTGESFWWLAEAQIDLAGGGDALLVLAVEATFGGDEEPVDGNQISFGRTRIRIDTPVAGTYTVTHPYGSRDFEVAAGEEADGINYTADIGAANFLSPAIGFAGTLAAFGPDPVNFLTWPDYQNNPDLQVLELDPVTNEPTGVVLEQYVGNLNIPSVVVGGTNGNVFRVDGPAGSNLDGQGNDFVETDLFAVMGKVFDPDNPQVAHTFPNAPLQNLYAFGPVNRIEPFVDPSLVEPVPGVTGEDFNYSVGYPIWYQENLGTLEEPIPGVQLTLCYPGTPDAPNLMCISDPIDPDNPDQEFLRTGGEGFWWSADARFDIGGNGDRALLVLGLEATFGGDESLIDGQQISFGRERIRIDTNESGAGTYRVTYPYGQRIFENVPADDRGINFTADIGIADPSDPDFAFVGALYGGIGPEFLKWTTFDLDPALTDPLLVTPNVVDPALSDYHVGNPGLEHEVIGSPLVDAEHESGFQNFFRVEKLNGDTWELVGETDLFAVSGKLYDPATFQFGEGGVIIPDTPVANPDASALDIAQAPSVTIDVLANDTIITLPATVAISTAPASGAAVVNGDNTVTYTPDAGFAETGGIDTFSYNFVNGDGVGSNIALVTVTVTPVDAGPVAPIAVIDTATLDMALATSVDIDVLANDTYVAPVTVNLTAQPGAGTAVINGDGTVTYTPGAGLAANGGSDGFTYNITDSTTLTSNSATVTVTVTPAPVAETIAIDRARFNSRNSRLDVRGTTNAIGAVTLYVGDNTNGGNLGSAPVRNGRWSFRATAASQIDTITVTTPNGTTDTSPVDVR